MCRVPFLTTTINLYNESEVRVISQFKMLMLLVLTVVLIVVMKVFLLSLMVMVMFTTN